MNFRGRLKRLESRAARNADPDGGHTCGLLIVIEDGQDFPPIPPSRRCDQQGHVRFVELPAPRRLRGNRVNPMKAILQDDGVLLLGPVYLSAPSARLCLHLGEAYPESGLHLWDAQLWLVRQLVS
jgi:hypothetical protein